MKIYHFTIYILPFICSSQFPVPLLVRDQCH